MKDIIVAYLVGFIISLLQEAYKSLQKTKLSPTTATRIRLVGGVLSVVASVLISLGRGTIDQLSFAELAGPIREALVYFLGSIAAYYSVIKDSRLNFSK